MVKVRKKGKNSDVNEISLLIEKDSSLTDWNDKDLIDSIMQEVDVAENTAKEIADNVKIKIKEVCISMGWEFVESSFIREFVSNEILSKGKKYKKKANKYNVIGLSPYEIKCIIENKDTGNNSNIRKNNPEAISHNISEILMKKYAFQEVFSSEVSSNHYSGKIYVHDSGQPNKFYKFSKHIKFPIIVDNQKKTMSLIEIWNMVSSDEVKIDDTEYEKDISELDIKIMDRGNYIQLKRIVLSKETKNMIDFTTNSGSFSVTEEHGCVVDRDGKIIIIRADEVKKSDNFIKETK